MAKSVCILLKDRVPLDNSLSHKNLSVFLRRYPQFHLCGFLVAINKIKHGVIAWQHIRHLDKSDLKFAS